MMTITVNIDGQETAYTFSDADVLALKNDLTNIPRWLRGSVIGKIKSCKERMCDREWLPKLRADPAVTSLPADMDALVGMIVIRADYKDRVARDAELDSGDNA